MRAMEGREHSLSTPTMYVLQIVIYSLIVCHTMTSMTAAALDAIIAAAASEH